MSVTPGARLRQLYTGPEIAVLPVCYDGLVAKIAELVGFKAIALGGYATGTQLGMTEPLLSLEDVADVVRYITRATSLPLMVDAGAGWGEPMHVAHTVRTLEHAGAAALHIEDQIFPKRMHYHRGQEHLISVDEMRDKIRCALEARTDPDFVVVARTDAMLTDGYEEGIRRARSYREAGADVIMLFPNDKSEARRAPRDLPGVPLIYLNATGHRLTRGVWNSRDLQDWGYRLVYDGSATILVAAAAVRDVLQSLVETGGTQLDDDEMLRVRGVVEDALHYEALYDVEASTVEKG